MAKKKIESVKIAHLHIQDPFGNKKTLICRLNDEGYINYTFYGGTGSSGIPFALSNLQCDFLPYEKATTKETKEKFKQRIIGAINGHSVYRVIHDVLPMSF